MAKRNVMVKNLHAVETLGAITLLATDKTGTLTQNKMTVVGAWMNDELYSLTETDSERLLTRETANIDKLVHACALCTTSKFDTSQEASPGEERKIFGDATEVGLLRFACGYVDVPLEQSQSPKAFEIPFNSQTKWHMSIHRRPLHQQQAPVEGQEGNSNYLAIVKGAPERIARMCSHIRQGDGVIPWSDEVEARFNFAYEHFATRGRRLLAIAEQALPADVFGLDHEFSRNDGKVSMGAFTFVGLIAIMDPPKHGVRKAISTCRNAGIQIVMVTGDHPITAEV